MNMDFIKGLFSNKEAEKFNYRASTFKKSILPVFFIIILLNFINSFVHLNFGIFNLMYLFPKSLNNSIYEICNVIIRVGDYIYVKFWVFIIILLFSRIIYMCLWELLDKPFSFLHCYINGKDYAREKEYEFSLIYFVFRLRNIGYLFTIDFWIIYNISNLIIMKSSENFGKIFLAGNNYFNNIALLINCLYFIYPYIFNTFFTKNKEYTNKQLINNLQCGFIYDIYGKDIQDKVRYYFVRNNFDKEETYIFIELKVIENADNKNNGTYPKQQKWYINRKIVSSNFEEIKFVFENAIK